MTNQPGGSPVWLGIFTVVLGAMAPLTAAVHGWVSKSRELDLAQTEQRFKTQTWFLETAVDTKKSPELRQQVLRFIAVSPDENLRSWATRELKLLDPAAALYRQRFAAGIRNFEYIRQADEYRKRLKSTPHPKQEDLKAIESLEEKAQEALLEANKVREQLIDMGIPVSRPGPPVMLDSPYMGTTPALDWK